MKDDSLRRLGLLDLVLPLHGRATCPDVYCTPSALLVVCSQPLAFVWKFYVDVCDFCAKCSQQIPALAIFSSSVLTCCVPLQKEANSYK